MRVGEPNALILADLANKVSDEVMREKWKNGGYGEPHERPRLEYVKAWRKWAGRD